MHPFLPSSIAKEIKSPSNKEANVVILSDNTTGLVNNDMYWSLNSNNFQHQFLIVIVLKIHKLIYNDFYYL